MSAARAVAYVRRESVRVALAAMAEADLTDVLPTIAVPTLLLWGELDERSPLSVAHARDPARGARDHS